MPMPSVILIAPPNPALREPTVAPPLGLLYLLAYARAHDLDTSAWKVVDLNVACYPPGPDGPQGHWTHDFSLPRMLAEVPMGADVYAFTVASAQVGPARALIAALRQREPQALFVAGGAHVSALPGELLEESTQGAGDAVDVVVVGEGETAFADIVKRLANGGCWTAGTIMDRRGHRPVLDGLPAPARDVLDWSRYTRRIDGRPATNVITSRGCPGRCAFCQQDTLWGPGLRMHSIGRVLEEVDACVDHAHAEGILFVDDSLTARPAADLHALAAGMGARGLRWRGWTRADLCCRPSAPATLAAMAAGGCRALCLGVEAGTDRLLAALDKRTTVKQLDQAIRTVVDAGIQCRVSFMVGSPTETWTDVEALVRFVADRHHLISDWILSSFNPLPGSPAWTDPARYGLVIDTAAARADHYRQAFVVAGQEEGSKGYHRHTNGVDAAEVQARHDYVQESLLRWCPRDRIGLTIGRAK